MRQHNQKIKGGAKKTKRGGPWRVRGYVHGFTTWTEALRFEWAAQHPHKSKTTRSHVVGMPKRKVTRELIETCASVWPLVLKVKWYK